VSKRYDGNPIPDSTTGEAASVAEKDSKRYTVAVDLDGVLHAYTGWQGPEHFEPPIPGAIAWLETLWRDFDVVIFTTRGQYAGAAKAINDWLYQHGYNGPNLRVTNEKIPALVYVDDRGYRFDGTNFPTKNEIHRLRPWWKMSPTTPAATPGGEPKP
jgi:hypothetical protein